jgi:hypothetical protein
MARKAMLAKEEEGLRYSLHTLSLVLLRRYEQLGNVAVEELDEAMSRCQEALALYPHYHVMQPVLVELESKLMVLRSKIL